MRWWWLWLVVGGLAWDRSAHAQCTTQGWAWTARTTTVNGAASTPVSDTPFVAAGRSRNYFAQNNFVYAVRNVAEGASPAGSVAWTWQNPSTDTIQNFPSPVVLSNGTGEFLFVTADDGFLYKLDANDPNGSSSNLSRDLRRAGCPDDRVTSTPTVQLYQFSNQAFRSMMDAAGRSNVDLIYVVTRFGGSGTCATTTRNRIVAYYSNDLTPRWTINASGSTYKIDFGADGCTLDYATNTLFCGTNLAPDAVNQNSLWAIDTLATAPGGRIKWSGNAGSIQTRPQLANGKLYVASTNGEIMAYNPAGDGAFGAAAAWTSRLRLPSASIQRNLWIEFRGGPFQGKIIAMDGGDIRGIEDTGTSGNIMWTAARPGTATYTSMPVVWPSQGLGFAGMSGGYVRQIDLSNGEVQSFGDVDHVNNQWASPAVYDPAFDIDPSLPNPGDVNALVAVSNGYLGGAGKVVRFCLPFPVTNVEGGGGGSCVSDAQCTPAALRIDPCIPYRCMGAPLGTCQPVMRNALNHPMPSPNGTLCNDGLLTWMNGGPRGPCTCHSSQVDGMGNCLRPADNKNDICMDGVCTANKFNECPCVNPGDRAGCTLSGLTCCGGGAMAMGNDGCYNLLTDPQHCGGCSINCGPNAACVLGVCASATGCSKPSAMTIQTNAPLGASAIDYEQTGGSCAAYVSAFRTGTPSSFRRISSAGGITDYANASGSDFTPIHGIAVTPTADQILGGFVNNGGSTVPGLGLVKPVPGTIHTPRDAVATATTGTGPFSASQFNQGPVGPAFNRVKYVAGMDNTRDAYFGNWSQNGDVTRLSWNGASWSTTAVTSFPGQRVSAIAFGRRWNRGRVPANQDHMVFIGHATILTILDVDTTAPLIPTIDVDLAGYTPDASRGESTPIGILAIAVHPIFHDAYVEVAGSNGRSYILNVDGNDASVRSQTDVNSDLHLADFPTANDFLTTQGRLVMSPHLELVRLVPRIDMAPVEVRSLIVTK